MKWKDLPIGTRIGALSALLSLLLILMGALSWRAMSTDRAQLDNLIHQAETSQQAVDKARSAQVAFKIQVQEWKNTLLRGGDPTAFAKYRDGFLKEGKVTQQHLTELLELVDGIGHYDRVSVGFPGLVRNGVVSNVPSLSPWKAQTRSV